MIRLAHLVVPFLIGNAICSQYEDIRKDIKNTIDDFLSGEEKLAPKIGWDRDESKIGSGINEHFSLFT